MFDSRMYIVFAKGVGLGWKKGKILIKNVNSLVRASGDNLSRNT